MNVRPMTTGELVDYFGSATAHSGFIAESDRQVVGSVGYSITPEDGFYAHSLFCDDLHPWAFASLHQRLIKEARLKGLSRIRYAVDLNNSTLKRMAEKAKDKAIRILYERELTQ